MLLLVPHLDASEENAILEWNETVLRALKRSASPPLLVARNLAIVHVALKEAVGPSVNNEAAVASAGFTAATALLPNYRAEFQTLREKQLTKVGDESLQADALALGERIAGRILDERANDASSQHVSYVPATAPGEWRRTPPFFRPPELPQWASKVKPFLLERPDQFLPGGPPPLNSARWAKAFAEIKELGRKDSMTRTAGQTALARFWSDFSYTETPPGHWNSIARAIAAQRKLGVAETAELFAVLNVALTDAGIACWNAKYRYNFWRPVTAIPRAGEDNNPETAPDGKWLPLLTSPAHPEYPSGHSTFSGAAAVVLEQFFGTDKIPFTVRSDAVPKAERTFESLRACAKECGESRVYGGIHYRFSCEDGMKLGESVAAWITGKLHQTAAAGDASPAQGQ